MLDETGPCRGSPSWCCWLVAAAVILAGTALAVGVVDFSRCRSS
jgi:hypothetical protein